MAKASPLATEKMVTDTPLPDVDPNQFEPPSPEKSQALADSVAMSHRTGLEKRAITDLTREKYLLHIDGEGNAQWADILNGSILKVPANVSGGLRLQYNLLRPLVDNWVAYHTAQEFQVVAQARPSSEARDKARIDTIWANDLSTRQDLNGVMAEALFFAAAFGSSPVHVGWRDDLTLDTYEPFYNPAPPEERLNLRPGRIDMWNGDPWDTVYNDGAKRNSIHWATYGRVYPAQMLRDTFSHVEGIGDVEGQEGTVSASRFQRIVNRWGNLSSQEHGSAEVNTGISGDELIGVICREISPGVLKQFPQGRLQIIATIGAADSGGPGSLAGKGRPFLLHDGPLPGSVMSLEPVFGGFRGDDALGKPYVADLDDLQILLNQFVTLEAEYTRRFARPPLMVLAGSLVDDTITTDDDAILELTDGAFKPEFMFPPAQGSSIYDKPIERTMDQMFRLGGWQAASRGESKSGDPAAKVVALMEADDTVFAPVNRALRKSVIRVLQKAHKLAKQYMTVPYLLQHVAGDDLAYLVDPYIQSKDLSDEPPEFIVVSGYGATPEAKTKQLMGYVTASGADGQPLLETEEFWRLNPDQSIRPPEISAKHMTEARAIKINYGIKQVAKDLRQQFGEQAEMLLGQAHEIISREYGFKQDDPPQLHYQTLSQLTQDENLDPMARQLAEMRQAIYYNMMYPPAPPEPTEPTEESGASAPVEPVAEPPPAGNPTMRELSSEVSSLTQQAQNPGAPR
ncbi:MAG: hypothetical protein KAJ55_00310 [Anaerolineales bacterium]|nr:hypothetical protein [Anaerolineales bacterium]